MLKVKLMEFLASAYLLCSQAKPDYKTNMQKFWLVPIMFFIFWPWHIVRLRFFVCRNWWMNEWVSGRGKRLWIYTKIAFLASIFGSVVIFLNSYYLTFDVSLLTFYSRQSPVWLSKFLFLLIQIFSTVVNRKSCGFISFITHYCYCNTAAFVVGKRHLNCAEKLE